ncbi:MAG: FAD-linked oxidase C-terminal domain-containing protein, partial [Anaerolineae bacterium]
MLQITKMLTDEYRELLNSCVHCGLCLQACPTYAVFGTEMDAPRGRIALMRAAASGKISQEDFLNTFAEHITLCLECRACESACPSGVQYGKLIEGARIALEELREPGPGERFVRWLGMAQLMPHVGQMKVLARLMWLYEALGLQWVVRTLNLLPNPLHAMEGILPPIPARYPDYSQPAPAIGEKRGTVAFFYGCIQEAFLANINAATVRVLQHNGYEVHFPQSQTCCGAAQWHTGGEELAKRLARQNIDAFAAYEVVVNNAGGCGLTLKEYPDLLKDDPDYAERAVRFAEKVEDFSEFLYRNLHKPPLGELRLRATYSDSCHLRHGQGVIDQPRALLEMIPGLELVELRDPDRCCGSAGIYNIVQSETASAVLDAKIEDIAATGADIVVTSNTGCHMQLVAGVRRARLPSKVLHLAEVLDLAYAVQERRNGEALARLNKPPKYPKPIFGGPALPERWLAWQARRLKRRYDTPLISLKEHLDLGQVIDDPVELLTYVVDGGLDQGVPIGVVFPYSTEDVQAIVGWGKDHSVPVVARGAGTGLAGGAVALRGGLILEFSHLKGLVELDVEGRSAVVQPGMVNLVLDEIAKGEGLYFPPDPASGRAATVGGNIGANAGGPHCFKYGVTTNYVTGLEVVLQAGQRVELGGRALDYPELDLVGLFTGAEGTLGVITEASVRLVRNPPAVKTLLVAFDSVAQAGEAVSAVIAAGLTPATMEMMGQRMMRTIEEYTHPGLPVEAGAALIIDVDGYPESVQPQIEEVSTVLRAHGAREIRVARSEDERTQIWYARKSAAGAMARLAIDHYTVDGSVPRSKLADTLRAVISICDELDLEVLFLLHAGDGNLHPMVLVPDPEDVVFLARLHEGGRRMAELFVAQGGTISGEHGIGIEKQEFMPLMYSEEELAVMHEVKTLFDPDQLFNPDKVFPKGQVYGACTLVEEATPAMEEGNIVAPGSAESASAVICSLGAAGRSIRVRGAGTKSTLFPPPDVTLSTANLAGISDYALSDLYVKVGAGTPLRDLQEVLAEDGMWVPLASPWPEATVGGIVASGFNAPLRMRYGAVRDLVLALTTVLPDGRVLRLGRPVMKNVAGYDLVKLHVGGYGTLGLITDVTLRL